MTTVRWPALLLVAVGMLVTLDGATDARASTSIAIPMDALVRASTAAALITPVTTTPLWENGRIVTYTAVHVDSLVAGSSLPDEVWVRTLGGEVGRLGQTVEGEAVLTVGRPSLVFLHPATVLPATAGSAPSSSPGAYAVTGRAQGQFAVIVDAARQLRLRRASGVGATVPPHEATHAPLAADALTGLTLEDAWARIGEAWSQFHAP